MDLNSYHKAAMRTSASHNEPEDKLVNAVLGLCGEAGELSNHLKKYLFHGHLLNNAKIVEELGDILWYVTQGAEAMGVSLECVAMENIEKLKNRYPEGFSTERSINREN